MASTFGGIQTCSAGLMNTKQSLYITNTNIVNADTEGYTKKTMVKDPGYTTTITDGVVQVAQSSVHIEQQRSSYLDQRMWSVLPEFHDASAQLTYLTQMETILNELDDTGLTHQLDLLNETLVDLSVNPDSSASKTAVVQSFNSLCDTLNNQVEQLNDMQTVVVEEIESTVNQINVLTSNIADLNEKILEAGISGSDISGLIDQRNQMVDELSVYIAIDVEELTVGTSQLGEPMTSFQIMTQDGLLVGDQAMLLTVDFNEILEPEITLSSTGKTLTPESGQLSGLIDLMDSNETSSITYYINELDEFAATLVESFNDIYSLHDPLFDENSTTAATIHVNEALIESPENLMLSSHDDEPGNVDLVTTMIDALHDPNTFNDGSFYDHIGQMSATLGAEINYEENMMTCREQLVLQIDLTRMSVSGVSLDEEASNLAFQEQIYELTSKALSVWDEIISITINQLGG